MRSRMAGLAALVALVALVAALPALSAPVAPTGEYQRALNLGEQAYIYGLPLMDTERVFRTSTSVNVSDGAGGGPVNQFSDVRRLANPGDRTVVAPNHDTLYSMAWLSLTHGPVVLHMPVARHRFVVFELVDPYTWNFAAIGSVGRPAGNYAVLPPRWHGRLPRGVHALRSPYTRVWVIGRTYIKDAADTPNVVRIQNEYGITPLADWGKPYYPPRPRHVVIRPKTYTIPGTQPGQDPLAFYDSLGDQLKAFPPPAADRPLLRQLATVGIGPGRHPSHEPSLDGAVRQGLRDGVAAGAASVKADVQRAFLSEAPAHNGWLVTRTGSYGTNYAVRAEVDYIGLGAPMSKLAMYPFTVTDHNLQPLTGARRYVVHFSAANLPFPVRSFWSLTLYDANGFLVSNAAHVYLINNRSQVRRNADGSLDLYIQPSAPTTPQQRANWLPSPAGAAFRLIMRLYRPVNVAGIVSGRIWQPPTVLPCLADGKTADGVACAN